MKITCQACQAKYTIADEKVVGKVVKIRCKKCGATIVVNGNETSSGSQPPGAGEEGGEAALAVAGSSEPWTVNVAEGDQRVMTEPELVAAYRAGVVTNDTYCWRDGMPDWAPIAELGPVYAACTAPGAAAGEFPAKGQDPSAAGVPARTSTPPAGPPRVSTSPKERNGAPAATSATAARRAGGRAAAADLFRGAAQAGGEDEVMTSAPPSLPAPGDGMRASASKDTGAAAPSMTATTEASGLIDIRQLGQQMRPSHDEKKKTRVDDIMNIGGGGGFGPSLAAPVLTAPSLEHYSQPPPGLLAGPVASQVKSRALMIVAVCAGLFFLVAAVGVLVLIFRGTGPGEERDRTPTASTTSTGPTTGAASGTAAASAEAPAGSTRPSEAASAAPSESPSAAASATAGKEAPSEPSHPVAAAPKAFVAPAAPREAPAAPSGGAEFNLGEARARLGAISGGVQTCKRGDTSGSGKVEIIFGASGAAQSATLLGGSPFDGTPTGKCVEARFRQARVPPFSGSPTTVTKSFTIN
jgi:predicted Zn finger-like uncharacterized protein